jgi:Uma2 family endonuclease
LVCSRESLYNRRVNEEKFMALELVTAEAINPPVSSQRSMPVLHSGDRLTRTEFERRYNAMPQVKKAELIEGVVYMPSPVSRAHAEIHSRMNTVLGVYAATTPGAIVGDNGTVRLDPDNDPQPDVYLRLDEWLGGNASVSADGYLEGAPELIVEIAASSSSYDLHDKKNAYRRNRVQEYIVWQLYEEQILWFRLENEEYVEVKPDAKGILRSQIFPGLSLDVKAMLKGDVAKALKTLQTGLASPAHKAFVRKIAKARK